MVFFFVANVGYDLTKEISRPRNNGTDKNYIII